MKKTAKKKTAARKATKRTNSALKRPKPQPDPFPIDGERLAAFAADMVEFIQGGGPVTGIWYSFKNWMMNDIGLTEEEIEASCRALVEADGRTY